MGKKKKKGLSIKEPESELKIGFGMDKDTPLFCFKHFNYSLIKTHRKHTTDLCFSFLERLQILSNLGWNGIRQSRKHNYGMNKMPKKDIKIALPACVTPDVTELHVLRVDNSNIPFIGLQMGSIFHVFFIEPDFGVVYDHE